MFALCSVRDILPNMKILFGIALFLYSVQAITFVDVVLEEWETWKLTHNQKYDSHLEEKFRLKTYTQGQAQLHPEDEQVWGSSQSWVQIHAQWLQAEAKEPD